MAAGSRSPVAFPRCHGRPELFTEIRGEFMETGCNLQLDSSVSFSGLVAGFGVPDHLDVRDIAFGSGTHVSFSEAASNLSGTLTGSPMEPTPPTSRCSASTWRAVHLSRRHSHRRSARRHNQ